MTNAYRSDTADATRLTYGNLSDPLFVQEWQRDHLRRVHTVRATRGTNTAQQLYHETVRRYDDLNRATRDSQRPARATLGRRTHRNDRARVAGRRAVARTVVQLSSLG